MWSKLDDQFYLNPKNATIDRDEQDLYFAGVIYCNGQLTDGFIPAGVMLMLCAWAKIPLEANSQANAQAIASRLVEHKFWEIVDGGYQVHDFLEWNISKEEALSLKKARSEAGKRGGVASGAKRQAIASARAQANANQNPTQSPSPSPSPSHKEREEEEAPSAAFSSSPDPTAERIYQAVSKTITFPSEKRDDCIGAIRSIMAAQSMDTNATITYLQPFFNEWRERNYAATNTAWLTEWAVSGEVPPRRANGNGNSDAERLRRQQAAIYGGAK